MDDPIGIVIMTGVTAHRRLSRVGMTMSGYFDAFAKRNLRRPQTSQGGDVVFDALEIKAAIQALS